jgi:ABC-type Fe3+ transport system substrate-binding protein
MSKAHMGVPLVLERIVLPTIQEMLGDVEMETIRWTADLNRFTDFGPLPVPPEKVPEVIATHQVTHLRDRDRAAESGAYANMSGVFAPMRDELAQKGFDDPTGAFVTFCVVPVGLVHHKSIKNPPKTWTDLAKPEWRGRVITFDMGVIHTLLTVGFRPILGDQTEEFVENIGYHGNPVNVNYEIDSGQADVAIMPLPFGKASRQGNVALQWPEDGAFVVPNVMAFKKDPDPKAIEVGQYLLSDPVQSMMSSLGLIPVNPNADLPPQVEASGLNLRWDGWDAFVEALNR